jgi:dihydroorotate dehydrogenase (fumarate)
VAAAEFHFDAVPGDTLVFRAEVMELKASGSLTKVTSMVGDRLQGEAELFFAHLEPGEGVPKLFEPHELLQWLEDHNERDLNNLRGSLSQHRCPNPEAFERAQYLRALSSYP